MNIFRRKKSTRYYFVSYSHVNERGAGFGCVYIDVKHLDGSDVHFGKTGVKKWCEEKVREDLKVENADVVILYYKEISKYEYDKNIQEGKDTNV